MTPASIHKNTWYTEQHGHHLEVDHHLNLIQHRTHTLSRDIRAPNRKHASEGLEPDLLTPDDKKIDGRSGKCERLTDMLEEVLGEGEAALVFTQYREMGHLLEELIQTRLDHETLFLHGGVPVKERDVMIDEFQSKGTKRKIFILSLRAGGLGLNLTAANHVFHFDRWWNPAVEAQATDRAHRVGQTKNVQVHKFVCIGTMEERIDRLLSEKQALADQIVGGGDEWLTGLSTDQLREYLTLSKEAIGEFERE